MLENCLRLNQTYKHGMTTVEKTGTTAEARYLKIETRLSIR